LTDEVQIHDELGVGSSTFAQPKENTRKGQHGGTTKTKKERRRRGEGKKGE